MFGEWISDEKIWKRAFFEVAGRIAGGMLFIILPSGGCYQLAKI
jgi:hypothetical protein